MSVSTPQALASEAVYGLGQGRGALGLHVIQTLRTWIVYYVADYERQYGLAPRTIPVPPTPESIHGGIDFETFSGELLPELIVVCQPVGTAERWGEDGTYGSWFTVDVGAIVYVEGEQNQARALADVYGTVLQKLLPQQGAFGFAADGTDFATRTRLQGAYGVSFPDETVRDILRATVPARTFLEFLVSDYEGPRVPPRDPYASPLPVATATRVEVDLIRGTPATSGAVIADGVLLDGTVVPPVVTYGSKTVNEPPDLVPDE